LLKKLCHFGEAAVYAHCFEKIGLIKGLKKTTTEFQQFRPIFIFLKDNAVNIIPVLLAQVTIHQGPDSQSTLSICVRNIPKAIIFNHQTIV
jgi:hypothetical protein